MKKTLLSVLIIAALACAASACTPAVAAPLPNEFATTQPNLGLINVSTLRSFDAATPGYVNIGYINGSGDLVQDPDGHIYAALKALPGVVNVPGTTAYINVNATTHIVCAGGSTTLGWAQGQATVLADPGCAFYAAVQARAN